MIRNYLKIGIRNIVKHKSYSIINIGGLAVGLCCCLLIFLHVENELSFDKYHPRSSDIYRINTEVAFAGMESTIPASAYHEGVTYAEEIPEIESFARMRFASGVIKSDIHLFNEQGVYADPSLFEIFDFQVKEGALDKALQAMDAIVIRENLASKLFGDQDALGRRIQLKLKDQFQELTIVAVIEDNPSNSSFRFDFVVAMELSGKENYAPNPWNDLSANTFVLAKSGIDRSLIEDKLNKTRSGFVGETSNSRIKGKSLQRLSDIHLNTSITPGQGMNNPTDSSGVYALTLIGMLILIIACINFSNLAIARSIPRAREIGVRKVFGAHKKQLMSQFMGEGVIMCLFAFVVALLMTEFLLPLFSQLMQTEITPNLTKSPLLIISCLALVMLTAALSGIYPSLIMSRFNAVSSLKGRIKASKRSRTTRALVIFQFTIAISLIVGANAVNNQVDFLLEKDLGYNDDRLIEVYGDQSELSLMSDKLAANPGIAKTAFAAGYGPALSVKGSYSDILVNYSEITEGYLSIKEIELLEGRLLKAFNDVSIFEEDTVYNVLVNEVMVAEMGWDSPLNQTFNSQDAQNRRFRVVGVMRDYHFYAATTRIVPLFLMSIDQPAASGIDRLLIKYEAAYDDMITNDLRLVWSQVAPDEPFHFSFMSMSNKRKYGREKKWKQIILTSSALAILVSGFGLLGLVQIAVQQRVKEIGIRKVLGASVKQIILLLNWNFSKPIMIAVILAIPISYHFVSGWLDGFPYRISMSLTLFILPMVLVFLITWLMITINSHRSATSNPVDAIRAE